MRAHSLRRTLWFANVVLGAGVVGLAAWWFLDVKPAAANPARLKADFAAKEVEKYKARPHAGVVQTAVVTAKDIEVIDRPDYRPLNYWIFSGPVPPAPTVVTPDAPKVDLPTGLETLGRVKWVIFMERSEGQETASDSVVTFEFNDKKMGRFKPGQFIHQTGQPQRFKLIDVRRPVKRVPVYEIVYDVHDDPKAPAVRRAQVTHDAVPKKAGPIQDVPPVGTPVAAPGTGDGAGKPRDGVGVVSSTPGGTGPEAPRAAPRFEELKPDIRQPTVDQVEVDFDQATFDYVRGKSVESLAETVKTQPAVDRTTGQALGLRITGFSGDSPADKFNVKPGDILVSVNGTPVRDRADLVALIQRMDPNISRVTVVIDRGGKKLTYNIDPRDPKTRRAARYLDNAR